MIEQARVHAEDLITRSRTAGIPYYLVRAQVALARLARLGGDPDEAETLAHQALTEATALSAKSRIVDCFEVLAGVETDRRNNQEAARLFGVAHRVRDETSYRRCVSERDADLDTLSGALGVDSFQLSYDHGRSLSLDEAVAYAQRGRGERRRPDSGWGSLTPAEVKVAELVKDGLSNPDIGKRLLCSARTVQAHLTHIYAKLGVSSRTELAAEATRQQD
jgi:DNA-binding CsgD family transcriptional regulator